MGRLRYCWLQALCVFTYFYLSARYGIPVKEQYNSLSLDPEPTLDFNRVHSIL